MRYRTHVTIGGAAIAVAAGLYALQNEYDRGHGPCTNKTIRTENSPDGTLRAVLFERACGAMTGTTTQVSILMKDEGLPDRSGNTFIIGQPAVGLAWTQARAMKISYNPAQSVFLKKTAVNGVSISYSTEQ